MKVRITEITYQCIGKLKLRRRSLGVVGGSSLVVGKNQLLSHGRLFRAGFLFFFGFPKYSAISAVNLVLPTTND